MSKRDRFVIEQPPNKHPVTELYAVLSVDANGNEGIIAETRPNGHVVPFVSGDKRHCALFEKEVRELGPELEPGTRVRLVTFKRDSERILWGAS